jgi:transketolase
MRALPNMTVLVPCDGIQTGKMTEAIAQYNGPVYMRTSRNDMNELTSPVSPFEIGKVYTLREGNDVTIFACRIMVEKALEAAERLESEKISVMVVNVATIKPLDRNEIIRLSKKTGLVITAEEHSIVGGLGSAVAEALRNEKIPIEFVGINDQFGVSCNEAEPLLELYGLTSNAIISTIKNSLDLKY